MKTTPLLKMSVESDFCERQGEMFSSDLGQKCHGKIVFRNVIHGRIKKIKKSFGEKQFISPIFLKLMYKDCIEQTINCGCWLKRNDT